MYMHVYIKRNINHSRYSIATETRRLVIKRNPENIAPIEEIIDIHIVTTFDGTG